MYPPFRLHTQTANYYKNTNIEKNILVFLYIDSNIKGTVDLIAPLKI